MALLETDAVVRRAAHQRLRDALRLLTGTRSFHNFCPHFHDSSDGALHIVSLQRYYYCLPVLVRVAVALRVSLRKIVWVCRQVCALCLSLSFGNDRGFSCEGDGFGGLCSVDHHRSVVSVPPDTQDDGSGPGGCR